MAAEHRADAKRAAVLSALATAEAEAAEAAAALRTARRRNEAEAGQARFDGEVNESRNGAEEIPAVGGLDDVSAAGERGRSEPRLGSPSRHELQGARLDRRAGDAPSRLARVLGQPTAEQRRRRLCRARNAAGRRRPHPLGFHGERRVEMGKPRQQEGKRKEGAENVRGNCHVDSHAVHFFLAKEGEEEIE